MLIQIYLEPVAICYVSQNPFQQFYIENTTEDLFRNNIKILTFPYIPEGRQ